MSGESVLGKIVNLSDHDLMIVTTKKGTIYILPYATNGVVPDDTDLDAQLSSQSDFKTGEHVMLTTGIGVPKIE